MAADMPVDGLRIGLFLPSPQFVQGPLQRRILQNQAVGDVDELAAVVLITIFMASSQLVPAVFTWKTSRVALPMAGKTLNLSEPE